MSFHLSDVSNEQLRNQMDAIYKKIESVDDVISVVQKLTHGKNMKIDLCNKKIRIDFTSQHECLNCDRNL
jgi:hypothetical protein